MKVRRRPIVGLLLGQRRRRWPNNKTTLGQRPMFAGQIWKALPANTRHKPMLFYCIESALNQFHVFSVLPQTKEYSLLKKTYTHDEGLRNNCGMQFHHGLFQIEAQSHWISPSVCNIDFPVTADSVSLRIAVALVYINDRICHCSKWQIRPFDTRCLRVDYLTPGGS